MKKKRLLPAIQSRRQLGDLLLQAGIYSLIAILFYVTLVKPEKRRKP